jgi:hypothetical protein
MPQVGFEPMPAVPERGNIVYDLESAAAVIVITVIIVKFSDRLQCFDVCYTIFRI